MIKRFAFAAYPVSDVPASTAFYRDVVGLTPGQSFGDTWTEFDVGESAFVLTKGESVGVAAGSQFSAAFEVDDVAAARARFVEHGVEVTGINDSPVCWSCFVTDPDGNRFAIHQLKSH